MSYVFQWETIIADRYNPAGEKELNVRHFQKGVFHAIL